MEKAVKITQWINHTRMKIKYINLISLVLVILIMPFIIAQDCPEGFICGESSTSIDIAKDYGDKISNPRYNPVTLTIIVILCIIILYIAYRYSKKRKEEAIKTKTTKSTKKINKKPKKSSKKK